MVKFPWKQVSMCVSCVVKMVVDKRNKFEKKTDNTFLNEKWHAMAFIYYECAYRLAAIPGAIALMSCHFKSLQLIRLANLMPGDYMPRETEMSRPS